MPNWPQGHPAITAHYCADPALGPTTCQSAVCMCPSACVDHVNVTLSPPVSAPTVPPHRWLPPDRVMLDFATTHTCATFFPGHCSYPLVAEANCQLPSFPFPHLSSLLFCSQSHAAAPSDRVATGAAVSSSARLPEW
jgi:hypothetical protein